MNLNHPGRVFLSVGGVVRCQIPTLSLFLSLSLLSPHFSISLSPSQSLSPLTPQSRLLGFLAEHRDRRKKKKKKTQKVESMKDILVEVCNLLLLCKLPTCCAYTQSSGVALTSAQQGCDHDTFCCQSVTVTRRGRVLSC